MAGDSTPLRIAGVSRPVMAGPGPAKGVYKPSLPGFITFVGSRACFIARMTS